MYEYKDLYTIDFRKVNNYFKAHEIIADELDFPDYYGCNFDALWDCLTDMVGRQININILGMDDFKKLFGTDDTNTFVRILKRLKHYNNDKYASQINITLFYKDRIEKID